MLKKIWLNCMNTKSTHITRSGKASNRGNSQVADTRQAERSEYTHQEAKLITDAFKLCTKVVCGTEGSIEPHTYASLQEVVKLAFDLINLRVEPIDIALEISRFPLEQRLDTDPQRYAQAVRRKFGVSIDNNTIRRVGDSLDRESFRHLTHSYSRAGVFSQQEMELLSEAIIFSHEKFADAKSRPWGPHERLPMFRHAAEVGMLLACAGEPAEVVAAGLLHDFLELYIPGVSAKQMDTMLYLAFTPRVAEIVRNITEPPKGSSSENWLERKMRVLDSLQSQGRDASTVALAAKISTMGEGNKHLYVTKSPNGISQWSKGSWEQNLEMFKRLRVVFEEKGCPKSLLDRYDLELYRWESFRPCQNDQLVERGDLF